MTTEHEALLRAMAKIKRYNPAKGRTYEQRFATLNVPLELLERIDKLLEDGGDDGNGAV